MSESIESASASSPVASALGPLHSSRARRLELQSKLPGSAVFFSWMGVVGPATARELLPAGSVIPDIRMATTFVSCDAGSMTLWGRSGLDYVAYVVIPRARIEHSEIALSTSGGGPLSSLLDLSVRLNDNTVYHLKIVASIGGAPTFLDAASQSEAAMNWINGWAAGKNSAPL